MGKHKHGNKPVPATTEIEEPMDDEDLELAKALGLGLDKSPKAETPKAEAPKAEIPTEPAKAEAEGGENEAPKAETPAEPEPDAGDALEALINKITDEADRELARKFLGKLQEDRKRTGQVKAWKAFDEELKVKLEPLFAELSKKHGVELVQRRIVVTFPLGKFSHTNAVVGKGTNGKGSSGTRIGFPEQWGKAQNGVQEYGSPSAMANSLGLQITGHRDMVDVFESQGYTVTELPACGRANVVIDGSDSERATRLKAIVKPDGRFRIVKKG